MIEILGWATSRAVARQFLETCNIATWDAEAGVMVPRADIQLHPFRATEELTVTQELGVVAPGFHFNIRLFGDLEAQLLNPNYDPDNPDSAGHTWSRLRLKTYIDNKLGTVAAKQDKALTGARLPGGYEWTIGTNSVRLYDAALVNNRANVWQ